ncbi:MAG TPA: hypothetical protein VIM07_03005, partial [Chitinophagaceae bacterium]
MMDQTHIGYTYWQQPAVNKIPDIFYISSDFAAKVESINGVPIRRKNTDTTHKYLLSKKIIENTFFEQDGYVSIQATSFTKSKNTSTNHWKVIPDIGREGDGITTFPVTASTQTINKNSPHLEYEFYSYDSGKVNLNAYFSPTLNFHNDDGLKYAISIDDEQPQTIAINKEDNNVRIWGEWVSNNIIIKTSTHNILKQGKHVVKYWMVSPAVVLQKIVLDFGGEKQSYLGPPETKK